MIHIDIRISPQAGRLGPCCTVDSPNLWGGSLKYKVLRHAETAEAKLSRGPLDALDPKFGTDGSFH